MLHAEHLRFAYGAHAVLRGVTLDVPAGGLIGILGPNGSGKTTLLRLLAGTLTPAGGFVTIEGRLLAELGRRAVARRIAVVPQDTHLAFDYSVLEVALMGRYPHLGSFEVEGPLDLAAVRDALDATGTGGLADRQFQSLSGGEKQRVIIASALAQLDDRAATHDAASRLLLLDEPTASLDLRYQVEVASLIARLHQPVSSTGRAVTIVLSTHDLHFAATVCTTVVLLADGQIVAEGAPRDVISVDALAAVYGIDRRLAEPLVGRLPV